MDKRAGSKTPVTGYAKAGSANMDQVPFINSCLLVCSRSS